MKRVQREFPKHYANLANKKKVMASRPSLLHQCDSQSSWPAQQASAPPAPCTIRSSASSNPNTLPSSLNHAHEHDREDSRFRRGSRWFRLTYVLIGIAIFVFLTLFLLPAHAACTLKSSRA